MKLFSTKVEKCCQEMFKIDLPSDIIKQSSKPLVKFIFLYVQLSCFYLVHYPT